MGTNTGNNQQNNVGQRYKKRDSQNPRGPLAWAVANMGVHLLSLRGIDGRLQDTGVTQRDRELSVETERGCLGECQNPGAKVYPIDNPKRVAWDDGNSLLLWIRYKCASGRTNMCPQT